MKMNNVSIMLLVLTGLCGCIPDPLPVTNVPTIEPKIVVSSQMVPGQGLAVLLTRSIGALDAGENSDINELLDQIVIDDADVTVRYNDRVDTLFNIGNGVYANINIEWEEGVSYELQVKTTELGTVTSTTQVRPRVTFDEANLTLVPTGNDSLLQVDYSLNDPAGKNYYVISLQKYSRTQDASDFLEPRIFNHLLDDQEFDGQHYADNFKIPWPRFHEGDSVALFMSSVSEDYYRFLKVKQDGEFSLVEFISEPLNYPTNVNGGYGYFNLHLPDVWVFELE